MCFLRSRFCSYRLKCLFCFLKSWASHYQLVVPTQSYDDQNQTEKKKKKKKLIKITTIEIKYSGCNYTSTAA